MRGKEKSQGGKGNIHETVQKPPHFSALVYPLQPLLSIFKQSVRVKLIIQTRAILAVFPEGYHVFRAFPSACAARIPKVGISISLKEAITPVVDLQYLFYPIETQLL